MNTGTSSAVVAAFVGPGTVLTCAVAGVEFGYDLAWVLVFATASVFVLQSFTASTGILARRGLGEALREAAPSPVTRALAFGLVVTGLWVGCAAFELGNLLGAAAGVAALTGGALDLRWILAAVGGAAGVILLLDLRVLIRVFGVLVVGMSLLFVGSLIAAPVDWGRALRGLVVPSLPSGSQLTVIALVGTTIVTYSLFLHASACKRYWAEAPDARQAWRQELRGMAVFLPIGGVISFAILAAGATLSSGGGAPPEDVAALAALLEPAAGPVARVLFGAGLLAAGLTSALTAPLAAAAGVHEIFGWPIRPKSLRYRAVWGSVLGAGLAFGLAGGDPLPAIVAAQAANGLLLPLIAGLMLYLAARQPVLDLPRWYQALGVLITLVCAGLGARTLWWVWTQLGG